VALNEATGAYTVHRTPTRSLDDVMKSFEVWRHQVLADGSTADYAVEDGVLSLVCSGRTVYRPSTIRLSAVDLDRYVAYEAGTWHIGIRSQDGKQNFSGVLRGELGPDRDPVRTREDQRIALIALADLYDLAFLTQRKPSAAAGPPPARAAERGSVSSASASPPLGSLMELAARGEVEGIQERSRTGKNPSEAAHALETAYGVRARSQMLAGQVDAALDTLAAGRHKFGKSAPLRDREAHYVVIGDAYDRLRLAVKLDVADLRSLLRQIEALEPDDSRPIEQMLTRVLADRIADQRAAGRSTVADDLLGSGRDLFPASAQLLTQGRTGALPETGVIEKQ